MIRVLGILIGLGFVIVTAWSLGNGVYAYVTSPHEETVEHRFHKHAKDLHLASDGPFGKFDRAQLQRGFQVYQEVCAACHSLSYVAFRNLAEHSVNGSIHFICMDWRHLDEMLRAGETVYSELKNLIIWVKDNGGMGTFYRSRHELIFAFKNGSAPHINSFELGQHGRYRTNVWQY